jgi:fructose-1,6-bisphosphatase II
MSRPEPVRYQLPDRNVGLDLMRVTEAAALAAGRWSGRGDKEGGDRAAVDAMRDVLARVPMRGVVVIGEGEKDEAPMLFNGEQVGDGTGPEFDIAVDPVDGTTLLAGGMPNAIAVMAAADRGSMYDPRGVFYMNKLVCPAGIADEVDIDAPVEHIVRVVARSLGGTPGDVTVSVQHRPRHEQLIRDIRAAGARVRLFGDGDVATSIAAVRPGTGINLMMASAEPREGIITACAMKAMGGAIMARLHVRDEHERRRALDAGHDLDRVLRTDDLVAGNNTHFVATGITDGDLLRGVRYTPEGAETESIVVRSRSGTVRSVRGTHLLHKLARP